MPVSFPGHGSLALECNYPSCAHRLYQANFGQIGSLQPTRFSLCFRM